MLPDAKPSVTNADRAAAERVKVEWEHALVDWARNHIRRDDLVRGAVGAGVSQSRVSILTGIARTTVARIVNRQPAERHHA